jgi:hypothetical protein
MFRETLLTVAVLDHEEWRCLFRYGVLDHQLPGPADVGFDVDGVECPVSGSAGCISDYRPM